MSEFSSEQLPPETTETGPDTGSSSTNSIKYGFDLLGDLGAVLRVGHRPLHKIDNNQIRYQSDERIPWKATAYRGGGMIVYAVIPNQIAHEYLVLSTKHRAPTLHEITEVRNLFWYPGQPVIMRVEPVITSHSTDWFVVRMEPGD